MSDVRSDYGSSSDFEGFEGLQAWKRARVLVGEVYTITGTAPFAKQYSLRDQLERAAVSVMSNIAEGAERGSKAEFYHFLSIAKGSCAEVRSLLYVALDVGMIPPSRFTELDGLAREVGRIVGGLRVAIGRQRDQEQPRRPRG